MDKPRRVFLVDGPGKGKVVDLSAGDEIRYTPGADSPPPGFPPRAGTPPTEFLPALPVTYKMVKAVIFGHLILIGSTQPELPEADVFNAIVTDAVRQCAVKLPRYRCQHQMSELPCLLGCHG